jgi:SAM-dependent methyltransferase
VDENAIDLQLDRPHSARMYDYYLGGRTNFTADREAVGQVISAFPSALLAARANREFMHRSTRYLAEAGLRQFLDIGTGIPTRPNLHEIAQLVAPDARIVYVDNDPIVLAHAQALLQSDPRGSTDYVQADLSDPDVILASPVLRRALDLTRPVALSLNAVLHFIPDAQGAHRIVEQLKDALAPGSALVVSHVTAEFTPAETAKASSVYQVAGTSFQARTLAEFERFFHGWELVDPGVTTTFRWHVDDSDQFSDISDADAACYVAVARKP